MKRVLNFTERKRIKRKNVSIQFIRQNGKVVGFTLEKLDLNDLDLPNYAKIYIEAYYRTELKRFDLGTINSFTLPYSGDLKDIAYSENSKFRILVIDPSDLKILAHADKISPDEIAGKRAILPVEFTDLGNEIWRVEYEGDEGAPILMINREIPNIQNIAKKDPQFLLYVYPAVLREILIHIVFVDKIDSTTEPTVGWHRDWLKFTQQLGVEIPESLSIENDNFNRDDILEWISNCITKFCNKYAEKFQEYVKIIEEAP